VDGFLSEIPIYVAHGGDRAYYDTVRNFIAMPPMVAFKTIEVYYATRCHETVHWSGGKNRLERDMTGRYGSKAYGFEELVAEFGAAFLCAHLGIQGELRHADYIANWLKVLKDDDRAIFKAASLASKASSYLLRISGQVKWEAFDGPEDV
jgi:antirestriction protein ArdC